MPVYVVLVSCGGCLDLKIISGLSFTEKKTKTSLAVQPFQKNPKIVKALGLRVAEQVVVLTPMCARHALPSDGPTKLVSVVMCLRSRLLLLL